MAIKDWKKKESYYINIQIKERLHIYKDSFEDSKNKQIKKYVVKIMKTNFAGLVEFETFKTKTQALKYAKSYMRKH